MSIVASNAGENMELILWLTLCVYSFTYTMDQKIVNSFIETIIESNTQLNRILHTDPSKLCNNEYIQTGLDVLCATNTEIEGLFEAYAFKNSPLYQPIQIAFVEIRRSLASLRNKYLMIDNNSVIQKKLEKISLKRDLFWEALAFQQPANEIIEKDLFATPCVPLDFDIKGVESEIDDFTKEAQGLIQNAKRFIKQLKKAEAFKKPIELTLLQQQNMCVKCNTGATGICEQCNSKFEKICTKCTILQKFIQGSILEKLPLLQNLDQELQYKHYAFRSRLKELCARLVDTCIDYERYFGLEATSNSFLYESGQEEACNGLFNDYYNDKDVYPEEQDPYSYLEQLIGDQITTIERLMTFQMNWKNYYICLTKFPPNYTLFANRSKMEKFIKSIVQIRSLNPVFKTKLSLREFVWFPLEYVATKTMKYAQKKIEDSIQNNQAVFIAKDMINASKGQVNNLLTVDEFARQRQQDGFFKCWKNYGLVLAFHDKMFGVDTQRIISDKVAEPVKKELHTLNTNAQIIVSRHTLTIDDLLKITSIAYYILLDKYRKLPSEDNLTLGNKTLFTSIYADKKVDDVALELPDHHDENLNKKEDIEIVELHNDSKNSDSDEEKIFINEILPTISLELPDTYQRNEGSTIFNEYNPEVIEDGDFEVPNDDDFKNSDAYLDLTKSDNVFPILHETVLNTDDHFKKFHSDIDSLSVEASDKNNEDYKNNPNIFYLIEKYSDRKPRTIPQSKFVENNLNSTPTYPSIFFQNLKNILAAISTNIGGQVKRIQTFFNSQYRRCVHYTQARFVKVDPSLNNDQEQQDDVDFEVCSNRDENLDESDGMPEQNNSESINIPQPEELSQSQLYLKQVKDCYHNAVSHIATYWESLKEINLENIQEYCKSQDLYSKKQAQEAVEKLRTNPIISKMPPENASIKLLVETNNDAALFMFGALFEAMNNYARRASRLGEKSIDGENIEEKVITLLWKDEEFILTLRTGIENQLLTHRRIIEACGNALGFSAQSTTKIMNNPYERTRNGILYNFIAYLITFIRLLWQKSISTWYSTIQTNLVPEISARMQEFSAGECAGQDLLQQLKEIKPQIISL